MPVPIRTVGHVAGALLRRPSLWPTAVRQARALAPSGWWKRAPFLPVPTKEYMVLRAVTQYGEVGHVMEADDVVAYLEWARQWRAASS